MCTAKCSRIPQTYKNSYSFHHNYFKRNRLYRDFFKNTYYLQIKIDHSNVILAVTTLYIIQE